MILNVYEIAELVGQSDTAVRVYLNRPEFNKFIANITMKRLKYEVNTEFWDTLYNFYKLKGFKKQMRKIKCLKNLLKDK